MIYLIAIFTLLPSIAWAGNINIPTIILTERLMLYSFVMIVGLEAGIIYKILRGLSKKSAFLISLKANLVTILLAVPLVWGIWLAIIMNMPKSITVFLDDMIYKASFLFSLKEIVSNITCAPWIIDTQSLLLAEWAMAPVYFAASYYLEYWFSRKKLKEFDMSQVKKAFFYANIFSYLMIMSFETLYQYIITPLKVSDPYLF